MNLRPNQVCYQKLAKVLLISASVNPFLLFLVPQYLFDFAFKSGLLSTLNQTVDYECSGKSTVLFLVSASSYLAYSSVHLAHLAAYLAVHLAHLAAYLAAHLARHLVGLRQLQVHW